MIERIKRFMQGVVFEMKKVTWPTWNELKGSTIVVLILSGILAIFLFFVDTFLTRIVNLFIE